MGRGEGQGKTPKGWEKGGGDIVNINQYMYLTSSQSKTYYSKNLYSPVTIGEKTNTHTNNQSDLNLPHLDNCKNSPLLVVDCFSDVVSMGSQMRC